MCFLKTLLKPWASFAVVPADLDSLNERGAHSMTRLTDEATKTLATMVRETNRANRDYSRDEHGGRHASVGHVNAREVS